MTRLYRLMAVLTVVSLALAAGAPSSEAQGSKRSYSAKLKGAFEVPAVDTQATGSFTLKRKGNSELTYTLSVADMDNIVAAHLHLGVVGNNGPVIVSLYSGAPGGTVNGVLAEGTITAASLVGLFAGEELADLIAAIEDGDVYVNVHSTDFPGGEIRAQVR